MNRKELADAVSDFITTSDAIAPNDTDDVDVGEAASLIEDFVTDLESDDEDSDEDSEKELGEDDDKTSSR